MFTTYIHTTTSTCVRIRHSPCALSTSARRLFHTARATTFALPGDHLQTFRNISLPHKLTGTVLHQSSSTLLEVQGQARVKCVIEGILDLLIMPRCGLYAKVLEGGEASSTAETQSRAAQASSPRLDCGRRRLPESVVAIVTECYTTPCRHSPQQKISPCGKNGSNSGFCL